MDKKENKSNFEVSFFLLATQPCTLQLFHRSPFAAHRATFSLRFSLQTRRLTPCVLGLKAVMKNCRLTHVLCLDMLCMQPPSAARRGGRYTALPSSSLSLSREAGGFSAVAAGLGLDWGEERARGREREGGEKQNKTDLLAL